jgi:diguanylate cyclase (GGDEF)-like protein
VSRPPLGTADDIAQAWLQAVARAGFLSGTRAAAQQRLYEFLADLVVAARQADPAKGFAIGQRLVAGEMGSPQVLGVTLQVLAERLPELVGRRPVLPELLAQLAAGFATAQRDEVATAAESLSRAEKLTWRTDQVALQARLQHALLHEAVTGLSNRAHLRAHLRERIAAAADDDRLGICLLRVDQFGDLNKALGHEAGDELLAAIAARLRPLTDFVAHLGDERFAVVVPDTDGVDDVVKMAEQAARALGQPLHAGGHALTLTAHAGIVERPLRRSSATSWLRDASVALDWAIADGVAHRPYAPARAAADLELHRLTAAMPDALDRGEFVPHFQPLYRLADRTVVGFEALARWQRPGGTMPGPQRFIPLAERTGLIDRLGLHILEQSCALAATWPGLLISVNLSPAQLRRSDLPATVAGVLAHTGLDPRRLQLEITESAALDEHRAALRDLNALGVGLAIDDFGTGHSSLALLSQLPIRSVKLAGEFLQAMDPWDGRTTAVLRHTIAFCRDLGITVTGEGIETETQERRLRDLGCHLGQGYVFAHPVPAAETSRFITPG